MTSERSASVNVLRMKEPAHGPGAGEQPRRAGVAAARPAPGQLARGRLGWPRPWPSPPALGSLADIDECVTGIHNCSTNETCFNVQGGFRCLAFECPENYRRSADT